MRSPSSLTRGLPSHPIQVAASSRVRATAPSIPTPGSADVMASTVERRPYGVRRTVRAACQDRGMRTRRIGSEAVSALGLGAMQLDDPQGQAERAEATVRVALDAGITLVDTALAYGPSELGADAMGANERLVASLLDRLGAKGKVFVATKGGHTRTAGGGWGRDSSAAGLHAAVDASLRNLGASRLDLYQHHRPDR